MKKKINSLEINEDLKKSLQKLFLEDSDSEKENSKISIIAENNNSEESDSEIESTDKEENNYEGNCDYYKALCKANGLFVLTKEENFILDLIDKIQDPKEKREMLQKYLDNYKNNKKHEIRFKEPDQYNLKEIMNRIKVPITSTSNNEINISELKYEVNTLKKELQEIKSRILF